MLNCVVKIGKHALFNTMTNVYFVAERAEGLAKKRGSASVNQPVV